MSRLPVLALTLLLLVGIGAAAQAAPIVINFDTLANGAVITNQYAGLGVVFSSVAGSVNYVTEQPIYNGTKPKFLCTGPSGGGINCTAETIVDFSAPVDDLTFQGLGINDTSTQVARIDIFQNAIYSATIIIPGASQDYDPLLLDLGAYDDITRIRLYAISDGGGIGWDTFTFDPEANHQVPEPGSTLLLLSTAMVGLAAARRRMRN